MSAHGCSKCGKRWGGYKAEHCTVCHETFSGTAAGDKHRRGPFEARICDTSKLEYDARKDMWRQSGGYWEKEVDDD